MKFKKWLEATEDEFMQHHRTGFIPSHAYARYEQEGGLSWLGNKSKYPVLIATKKHGQYQVEFRQTGEKLKYASVNKDGDLIRGADGLALNMSDEEIKNRGLATHEQTIVAFVNDKPIGMASNEFNSIGVWVERPYQGLGIGSDLMMMFMEQNKEFLTGKSKIGQMTNAGENMSRVVYRKLMQKYGNVSIGNDSNPPKNQS